MAQHRQRGYAPIVTPTVWLERLVRSDPFLSDVRNMIAIPDDVFSSVLDAVEKAAGFIGWQRLVAIVRTCVPDEAQASSLAAFIMNFNDIRRDFDMSPERLVEDVASQLPEVLTGEEQAKIADRLGRAVTPKEGLERQAKAESVVRRTGAHLDEFSLVSDLRPVFDDARERIVGLVPMTILKFVVHRSDNVEHIEAYVTEDELNRICAEAERAKRKIAALKQFVKSNADVGLPESIMTLSETSDP